MFIGGLQKFTLIDFPQKIACTVFTIGCPFRCPFCYSGELVLPEKIKKQPKIIEKTFFDFLKKKKGFLEGVVLCGGEPTFQKDLAEFIKKIKDLGFAVKLDTNGLNFQILKKLIDQKLIDYTAMDIKASKEKYDFFSGTKNAITNIEKSIDLLKKGKIDFEFRTTIAPGLFEKDFLKIANWIGEKNVKYFLQEFKKDKEVINPIMLNKPILDKEEVKKIIQEIKSKFKICKLR